MAEQNERRHEWRRIIGIERRGAPMPTLEGHALPDPSRLLDEEFQAGPDTMLLEPLEDSEH